MTYTTPPFQAAGFARGEQVEHSAAWDPNLLIVAALIVLVLYLFYEVWDYLERRERDRRWFIKRRTHYRVDRERLRKALRRGRGKH